MSRLDDPTAVAAQYALPDRFEARVRLYRLYSRARPTWNEWLWDQIDLRPGERALEAGVGTGNLWRENAHRLPALGRALLTDLSAGMLRSARGRIADLALPARFVRADVRRLPVPDAGFDVAIANHMLYHVRDRGRALSELARALAPGGRCCVGTNEWTHQIELRELIARFEVESSMRGVGRDPVAFDLETAADELAAVFPQLRVARRHEHLEVTDAAVVGDYLRSICPSDPANLARIGTLQDAVANRIAREGAFHLTAAAGIVVAMRSGQL